MKIYLSMLTATLLAFSHLAANASIILVKADDFIAIQTESFEQFDVNQYHSGEQAVFNNTASINGHIDDADTSFFIAQNGRWTGSSQSDEVVELQAIDGSQFLATRNYDYLSINFFSEIRYFGGYFSDVSKLLDGDLTFDFFDQQNKLIDSFTIDFQTIDGEMTWAGFYSDVLIGSVSMSGYQNTMDGLRIGNQAATSVPEPISLSLFCASFLVLLRRKGH